MLITFLTSSAMGCGLINSDEKAERTYPEAFSLERVSIEEVVDETAIPDSVNIDVFVTDISKCPKSHKCFLPDGIFVSESLTSDESILIPLEKPRQFRKQKRYLISVLSHFEGKKLRMVILLGYSRLE
jgi:hypothetical protein